MLSNHPQQNLKIYTEENVINKYNYFDTKFCCKYKDMFNQIEAEFNAYFIISQWHFKIISYIINGAKK